MNRFLKKISKNALFTWSHAGIFRGVEAGSTKGGLERGSPPGGSGALSPRTPEKFSKNLLKTQWQITIFKKIQENFAIFSKFFWKFYRIFVEKVDLLGFGNMHLLGVQGAKPLRHLRIYENLSRKIPWNFLKNFINSQSIFYLTRQF